MIADAQRIGDDSERRVHGADRDEETGIDDIEVIKVVSLAIEIERRCLGVAAEADGPGLMRRAADRDVLAEIERAWHQMRMEAERGEHGLELGSKALVALHVVL